MTPLEMLAWLGVILVGLMVLAVLVLAVAAIVMAVRQVSRRND